MKSHTADGGLSIYGPSYGSFPRSRFRRARKLRARLEKYARILDGTSSQSLLAGTSFAFFPVQV